MKNDTETILVSQMTTVIAAILTLCADTLADTPNWEFAVIPSLAFACLFMILPYIICKVDDIFLPPYIIDANDDLGGYPVIEECYNKPVIDYPDTDFETRD